LGLNNKTRESGAGGECAISVGEHVWVSGRREEYVVMGVDCEKERLQVLRVGATSGLESVPLTSVKAVLAPKTGEAHPTAA
jgi:hypothetical protein